MMKHLNEGDILYRVLYYPEICLEIYQVKRIPTSMPHTWYNTVRVEVTPIIGDTVEFWIESDVNLNKLIKHKPLPPPYYPGYGYFLTTNEDLAIKKLKTLLQYAPKNKK